ncbi:dihydrofolate reductase [Catenovulum sediminis]|uniref:Dihydrofolate reductase n=1 Tax=Catenovulum sediminis TaxID=1740262 RepID=A0ABV1RDL7_9ALTE
MKLSMIAAMTPERAIGKDNKLLWHMPADLKFFKQTTLNKPIIMGRKTFDSIGRPLPGRLNIVVSRQTRAPHPDVKLANSPEQALEIAKQHADSEEIVVIGGGHIYETFLPYADILYITWVDASIEGDAFFPEITENNWQPIKQIEGTVDEKNQYPHKFVTYARRS